MRRLTATLATIGMLGALGACGSTGSAPSAGSDGARDTDTAPTDEAGAADDSTADGATSEICPATLPAAPGGNFGTSEPAAQAPDIASAQSAWVCQYALDNDGWQRDGEPVEVDRPTALPALDLQPAPKDRACTEELGPRWLLVTDDGEGDRSGVLADDYGCEEVRVTDDPATVPAGESDEGGAVSGVLVGVAGLAAELAALHQAG